MKHALRTHLNATLLVLLAASANCSVATDNHYRWQDERGKRVYSDRPPPKGVDYEVVSSSSRLKRVVSAEEGAVPLATNPTPGNSFAVVNPDEEGRSQKNAKLCEQAKMNLTSLESKATVRVRNNQGELNELSAGERELAKKTTAAQIDVYCD